MVTSKFCFMRSMSTGTWDLACTASGAAELDATGEGRLTTWGGALAAELMGETMMGLSERAE
jgi:hypothetical protein